MRRLLVLALLVAGCGGSSEEDQVREAARDLAAAAREGDGARVCQLLFSHLFLPAEVARQLGAPQGDGSPADFDHFQAECVKDMDGEEFTGLRETPVPDDVVVKEIEPVQGITAVATGEGEGNLMQFVEYRDEWRILFITN